MTKLLLILGLLISPTPATATWTSVQAPAGAVCADTATCTVTLAATGSGNLLIVRMVVGANRTVATCCSAGCSSSWTAGPTVNTASASAMQWYCLNSASGVTSFTFTWNTACSAAACQRFVQELSSSNGGIALDTGTTPTCSASGTTASPVSCALAISGANSVFSINAAFGGTLSACNQAFTCIFNSGNGSGFKIDQTSYTAPAWTGDGSNAYALTAAAFKEAAAGTPQPPTQMMMGVGD